MNRSPDEMWDYGYRLQFTPDRRGDDVSGSLVDDFGLDKMSDQMSIIASINGFDQSIDVCTWTTFADLGQIDQIGCTDIDFTGVAGSSGRAAPTVIDGTRLSTLLVEGDYLTGHTTPGGLLLLNLWRVAPTEP